jgi:hypothetical protein
MQKGHSLLSVRYIADVDLVLSPSECLAHQNYIGGVIIHEKDLRQWLHYPASPSITRNSCTQMSIPAAIRISHMSTHRPALRGT